MKKTKVLVAKSKFDNVLGNLLRKSPIQRKQIKTQGRKGSKTPILAKP